MPRIGLAEVEISLISPLFSRKLFRYARLRTESKVLAQCHMNGKLAKKLGAFGVSSTFVVFADKMPVVKDNLVIFTESIISVFGINFLS